MDERLWTFEEFPFEDDKLNYYETIFATGNGYLGMRGAFEEGYPGAIPAILVHGIYDHAPGMLVPELVNIPNWLNIHITIDGTPFNMRNQNDISLNPPNGALLGYRRVLDMKRAILRREVLFRAQSGSMVRLVFERFTSLHDVHVMAQRVAITAIDGAPQIELEAAIDANVTNAGVHHLEPDLRTFADGNSIGMEVRTMESGYGIGLASTLNTQFKTEANQNSTRPTIHTTFTLERDQHVEVDKITAIYTSRDVDTPLEAATEKVHEAASQGYETLRDRHISAWEDYWADSDIRLIGDEYAQRALRFALYHILIAAPREDDQVSVGAKTLSGFGYKGHVFWDTELFILPPLTLTQPQLARNLLMYRYHRLEGARKKARENGFEGAMFPWESTDSGEETTPQWSDPQPDGTRIRIWTGDSEQHISTDIAYAVDQYWRWTGDNEFLTQYGAEIILDTARFWGSRVESTNGRYEISQQVGADEYHENVDNSVFTNRMVVWHMETALKVVDWLQKNTPRDAERLATQLQIDDATVAHWQDIASKMFIPFDEEKKIHVQFPGFFDLEYIPVAKFTPRTLSVAAMIGHQRQVQSQVIKQADVIMLMALLGTALGSQEVMLNNWRAYYPRTDHGSSLSPSIHSWVAARLGLDDVAYELFHHAAGIDLNDNKGNVKDGIHGAACGGLWQALVFGFCGLHINDAGEIAIDPRLPESWQEISFTVYFRGERQQITVQNPAYKHPS